MAVTNTGYDGMPTSLGIAWMLIHSLGLGSLADKPHTSHCPSVSVADITPKNTLLEYCAHYKKRWKKGDFNAVILRIVSLYDVSLPSSANPTWPRGAGPPRSSPRSGRISRPLRAGCPAHLSPPGLSWPLAGRVTPGRMLPAAHHTPPNNVSSKYKKALFWPNDFLKG